MTEKEALLILKDIDCAYSGFIPLNEKKAEDKVNFWVEELKELSFERVKKNLDEHIKISKYSPSIADLRNKPERSGYASYEQRTYENLDFLYANFKPTANKGGF